MRKVNPVMLAHGLRMVGEEAEPEEMVRKEEVNLFRQNPPKPWVERPVRRKKGAKKKKALVLAHTHKFCTACGKKFFPKEGELQSKWAKVRTCGEDCEEKGKPLSERGAKFCMNCGTKHTLTSLVAKGVDPVKGLSTWAACCKPG